MVNVALLIDPLKPVLVKVQIPEAFVVQVAEDVPFPPVDQVAVTTVFATTSSKLL